jgi:hypothetical protein
MRNFWLILSVFWLWTCSGGSDKATGPEEPPIVINLTSLGGQAQKGPFNNGTSINVAELSNTLSPTGRNFSSAIKDNTGRFSVANVQLESPFVELRATGFYFNEVSNNISDAQLTLYALSDLTGKSSLNVNILTHLEKNRMINLMSGDNPKTFAQAKIQSQEEVFAIFDYSRANVPESELLDISQDGAANAKLLAMSAIIQGDLTVGQMSQLLANISTDIASDGTLDDTNLRNTLIENSKNLDMAEVRSNLVAHYTSLGISATIPDFETEINQFLKPPVAQDMSASTDEDTTINITLDASDPEGESLTYTILEVNNATVTLNGNVATYTPDAHFNGTDTFTFYANDGTSDSNIATVTMTVSAEDDEPNTLDVATTTDEDVAVAVNLSAEEYDGDSYSFAIITDVSNGTTSLNGSTVTYTPNQDFNGEDTFTFEATDDTGRTINVATATITVNPVNDAPIANDITNQVTNENRMMQLDITLDATDVDGDALTYNIISTNNGSVTINDNIATYVPNQDWNGEDTFTYVASDGIYSSNTATVTITVNSVNDPPLFNWPNGSSEVLQQYPRDEDSMTVNSFIISTSSIITNSTFINELYNAYGEDDEDIYVIVKDIVENGTMYFWVNNANPAQSNVVALNDTIKVKSPTGTGVQGHFYYIANENYHGEETFSVSTWDGINKGEQIDFELTINPVNDAPVANDITNQVTNENRMMQLDITLDATDVEDDDLTYILVSEGNDGTAGITNDVLTYTPNQDWNGTTTLLYKANDGSLDSNTATVTITVNSVNDVPVTSNITQTQDEDNSEASDLSSFTSDIDGDDLTYSIVTDATNGTTSIDGSIVTYTPNANFHGTDSYTYKANDGTDDSNTSTVTITVASVNDAPVANDVTVSTQSRTGNMRQSVIIILDASDVEGDDLTYSIVGTSSNGTLSSITNNYLVYTPTPDWNGEDTFTYKANDGTDDSNTATVTVTVTSVNDAPVTTDQTASTDEDTAVEITLTATDGENDNLTYTIVSDVSNGTTALSGTTVTYTPTANFNGTDTFTFKANDGTDDSNTSTITITVASVNDAPTVGEDLFLTVKRGHTIEFTLKASDVDNNNLNYNIDNIVNNITSGTIQSINDSTFRYLSDYYIDQILSYSVNDGSLESDQANIYITVDNSLYEVFDSTSIQAVAQFGDGTSISVNGDRIEFINSWGGDAGGGSGTDFAGLTQLEETKNGKVVACGSTGNFGVNLMVFNGWLDYESSQYNAMACAGTYDFGYIGATISNDYQTINFYKLNSSLEKIWENSVQVSDGCCLNALKMVSLDNNTHVVSYMENYSYAIGYVIFNDSGEIISQNKITRNTGHAYGVLYNHDIIETDSGFVLSYQANATNYLLNVNTDGTVLSDHQFGKFLSCKSDSGGGIKRTSDGGYILVGFGESYGHAEDISCAMGNQYDGYIFKLDSSFNIEWKKTFGLDSYSDGFNDVIEVSDGYLAVGWVSFQQHTQTAVFVKFDKQGNGIY